MWRMKKLEKNVKIFNRKTQKLLIKLVAREDRKRKLCETVKDVWTRVQNGKVKVLYTQIVHNIYKPTDIHVSFNVNPSSHDSHNLKT